MCKIIMIMIIVIIIIIIIIKHDPELAHLGHWAVPSLLQRWWARVSIALQTQNANAVRASVGARRPHLAMGLATEVLLA